MQAFSSRHVVSVFVYDRRLYAASLNLVKPFPLLKAVGRDGDTRRRFRSKIARMRSRIRVFVGLIALSLPPAFAIAQTRPPRPPAGTNRPLAPEVDTKHQEEMLSRFRSAVAANPTDAAAHDGLGVALAEFGRTSDAIGEFRKATQLAPNLPSAHLHLALAYDRAGQTRLAIAEYATDLSLEPGNVDARYALSAGCWKIGDRNGAILLLRQIARENPPFAAEVWYNLGVELQQVGQLNAAAEAFHAALARTPGSARTYLALGKLETEQQKFEGAVENLRKAASLASDQAEYHYALGEALRLNGNLGGAMAEFRQALRLSPPWLPAHRQLGIVLRQKGQYAEAEAELEQAVALDASDAQGHYYLGSVLISLGNIDGAIAELGRAIELDAYDSGSHRALAAALARAGKTTESQEQRKEAQALDELTAKAGRSRVLLGSAIEHLQRRDVSAALGELRQAVRLSPDYPDAHLELARTLAREGSHEVEVIQTLQRTIQLDAGNAEAHLLLGQALERSGQKSEAMAEFRRAAELAPSLAEAHRELAHAAIAAHQWKAVISECAAILAWNTNDAEARQNLALAERRIHVP